MIISSFPAHTARNSGPAMTAFINSLSRRGIKHVINNYEADAAIIWSMLWRGKMEPNREIFEMFRKKNKPVIVIEVGMLARDHSWRISVNGLNKEGRWGQPLIDPDRWKKFNVSLRPWAHHGEDILIACQHERSWQWRDMPSTVDWIRNTVAEIRKYSDRIIRVRPHPRWPISNHKLNGIDKKLLVEPSTGRGAVDIHYNFHHVINGNATPGIWSVLQGTPVTVFHTSWAAEFSRNLRDIESPVVNQDRRDWLVDLCHKEWFVDEIDSGIPLDAIMPELTC